VRSLDGTHAGFPVLVAQGIAHGVGLSAGAEQTAEVGVGLEVADGEEERAADQDHGLPNFLVVSPPAGPPLQEEDEVGDIAGHLRGGGRSAVLVVNESVVQLPGHADDHMVEIAASGLLYGLKCLPLGTSWPKGGLKW
jgi:hypothetical protein